MVPLSFWIGFHGLLLAFLALDLGVFHRAPKPVSLRDAAIWSVVWIVAALAFNAGVYAYLGPARGLEFFTGYLIERALSIDNIFVFVVVFSYFGVPGDHQHRVLFWGILGALGLRGALIAAGAVLLERFHWVNFLFGAFVLVTGVRFFFHRPEKIDVGRNPVLRLARRFLPVTQGYEGGAFLVKRAGGWAVTPLLLVLLVVESVDVAFALDSIPAIFAVTRVPFIVYTSNVFAILGLRASYFLMAALVPRLTYLSAGLAAVLVFIGLKMLGAAWFTMTTGVSLLIVLLLLGAAAGASLLAPAPRTGKAGNRRDAQ
ncbi:MAG TPA: TerC/Alx family metal homeostasis membrane protein [Candidatus Acidoferrales bacterium]|nr:TerC/Alx family metal homeostasis membrane protein [Candidatus Acidoferrales bacterium]